MVVQAKQARCTTTTLEEQTQKSETEEVPQCANCPSPAQHQTGETPLGWVNRRLCAFIQTFPRASWIDNGWRVWCRGIGGVWKSMSAFWWQRYWSLQWGLKDMTGCNYYNPTSLHSRDCNLTTRGMWNGCASLCINFWSDHFVFNTDAEECLTFPMQGTPFPCYTTQRRRTLPYKLTWNLSEDSWEWTGFGQPPSVKLLSC